jgi:heme a synthase
MRALRRVAGRAESVVMTSIDRRNTPGGFADVLAIGFGTTVSMWAVGYVCRLPPAVVPSWLLLLLLLACLLVGGFTAGLRTHRGWRGGLAACLLAAVLNLMVLGGLLSRGSADAAAPSALWWAPCFFLVSAILGSVGGAAGRAFRTRQQAGGHRSDDPNRDREGAAGLLDDTASLSSRAGTARIGGSAGASPSRQVRVGSGASEAPSQTDDRNWVGAWAKVLVAATLLLLIIGGMVTGYEAGLSVVDWPNSFGYNMFLYPLSRMTGGVYYEHSHRLLGGLVGLTTLSLAVYLQRNDARSWLRRFAWVALAAVITQGILGGLRVTGRFTLSSSPQDTAPSIVLAIVHGTVGQVFFAMTVAIAVFTSTAWKRSHTPSVRASAATDRALAALLVGLLIVQLVFGAILRHIAGGLFIHLAMAVIVILAAVNAGGRAWGIYVDQSILHRLGRVLLLLAGVQVLLGIAAYIAAGATSGIQPRPAVDVIVTTAHQASGALVLVVATMLMLWNRRLLVAGETAALASPCKGGTLMS